MPVLGIDVGGLTSTVATISKGTIDIVLNNVAQRYTPTCVSYTQRQRLFGDTSQAQLVSNYKNTCRYFINLLGLDGSQTLASDIDKFFASNGLQMASDGYIGYEVQPTTCACTPVVTTSSVTIGFLNFLVEMANSYTNRSNFEVVLACPGYFTPIQEAQLRAAAIAAGLSCLNVITDIIAMVTDYGIYRVKSLNDEAPTRVALVQIGHLHASAAIVDFYASHCKVLSQVSKRELGGRKLDYMLMQHMSREFYGKYKLDPLSNPKTRLKVEAVATKTKRVLSANAEAGYNVECLMEDCDLSGCIKRDQFEEMCRIEFLPQLEQMLIELVQASGLDISTITAVEIAGGTSRIPCVQQAISTIFGKPTSRTLNADECIARGCVLEAAMRSMHYKVREYKVIPCTRFPLIVGYAIGKEFNQIQVATSGTHLPLELPLPALPPTKVTVGSGNLTIIGNPYGLFCLDIKAKIQNDDGADKGGALPSEDDTIMIRFSFSEANQIVAVPQYCEYTCTPAFEFDIDKMAKLEKEFRRRDVTEDTRLKTLNDFETLLYACKDKMNTTHQEFISQTDADVLSKELAQAQDWIFENTGASLEVLQEAHDKIYALWQPIEEVYRVYQAKLQDLEPFLERLYTCYSFCCADDPGWYGATADERSQYAQALMELDTRVRDWRHQETNLPKSNKPLYTMQQVESEFEKIQSDINNFCTIKKKAASDAAAAAAPASSTTSEAAGSTSNDKPNDS